MNSFPVFISISGRFFHVIDARHIPLGVIFFTLGKIIKGVVTDSALETGMWLLLSLAMLL